MRQIETAADGADVNHDEEMSVLEMMDFMVLEICHHVQAYYALKGGYALSKLLNTPRLTHDIDFSIGTKEDYEKFKETLIKIGEVFKSKHFIDEYIIKPGVEKRISGGADYKKNGAKIVGIDIGMHQLQYGIHKVRIDIGEVNMFKPERMLSDKISSILSRRRFRRTKDIYDLYCIVNAFDIDYAELKMLVDMRMADHMEDWENIPFNETVIIEYGHAYDKLSIKDLRDATELDKPAFGDVINIFYRFIEPVKYSNPRVTWNSGQRRWF